MRRADHIRAYPAVLPAPGLGIEDDDVDPAVAGVVGVGIVRDPPRNSP